MSNVTYTVADLTAAIKHAVGLTAAGLPTGNSETDLINDAIQLLAGEHDWNWTRKPLVLDFTAHTNSSLVRSSNVLTVTSNAHGLVAGDFVRITGSTSADGEYYVASAATNTFTLNQTGSDATLAAPGSWIAGFVALAADFDGLLNIERNSQIRTVFATSMDRITRFRTSGGVYFTGPTGFYYAIRTIPQTGVTAQPTKRLELYPTPTAAETAALAGEYRRMIPKVSGGTDVPDIGLGCHALLRYLCRGMAVSSQFDRDGADWAKYERMLPQARERDGGEQSNLGMLEGGMAETSTVSDPLYPTRISPA